MQRVEVGLFCNRDLFDRSEEKLDEHVLVSICELRESDALFGELAEKFVKNRRYRKPEDIKDNGGLFGRFLELIQDGFDQAKLIVPHDRLRSEGLSDEVLAELLLTNNEKKNAEKVIKKWLFYELKPNTCSKNKSRLCNLVRFVGYRRETSLNDQFFASSHNFAEPEPSSSVPSASCAYSAGYKDGYSAGLAEQKQCSNCSKLRKRLSKNCPN